MVILLMTIGGYFIGDFFLILSNIMITCDYFIMNYC